MNDDPAIEAVRDARKKISDSVGNDMRELVKYYMRLQERHGNRLVRPAEGKTERRDDSAA